MAKAVPGTPVSHHQLFQSLPTVDRPLRKNQVKLKSKPSSTRPLLEDILSALPKQFGTVQKVASFKNSSEPPVILLQDIHLNPEAQKNTAHILENLSEENLVGEVLVEGFSEV